MANNNATHRIISARVPISIYKEMLDKAIEIKVSISDYLVLLITSGKKPIQTSVQQPGDYFSTKQQVADYIIKIPKLEREIESLKRDLLKERKEKDDNLSLAVSQKERCEKLEQEMYQRVQKEHTLNQNDVKELEYLRGLKQKYETVINKGF